MRGSFAEAYYVVALINLGARNTDQQAVILQESRATFVRARRLLQLRSVFWATASLQVLDLDPGTWFTMTSRTEHDLVLLDAHASDCKVFYFHLKLTLAS